MKTLFIGLIALAVLLTGCASGPAYQPAATPGGYGYRDTRLTAQHYRVSFSGDYGTARETVENFALFRAAQVTLLHGDDHFRVVSQQTWPITDNTDYGPTALFGYGYGWGSPFWAGGIGLRTAGETRTRYESVIQIEIGPDVPDQGPDIYDARQVKQNLAPEVSGLQR